MRTASAALAALVLVGCTLLVSWHRATVTHGVCVEHGEEIHLSPTQAEVAAPRAVDPGEARLFAGAFAIEDGDHHCSLLATSHGVAGFDDDRAAVARGDLVGHPALAPASPAIAGARYRLAPKTSPPA